jgi:hypothetical protein
MPSKTKFLNRRWRRTVAMGIRILTLTLTALASAWTADAQTTITVVGDMPKVSVGPCSSVPDGTTCVKASEAAVNVPEAFRPLWTGINDLDTFMKRLPCDHISLSAGGGLRFSPGNEHELAFFRDGRASLRSQVLPSSTREYEGTVEWYDFARLCYLVQDLGIERAAAIYTTGSTDARGVTIEVVMGDRRLSVVNYGGAAPIALWGIEQAIEGVRSRVVWKPKD